VALGTLLTLLSTIVIDGWERLNPALVSNMPSARPERAGIQSAIFGSLWVVGTTAAVSVPLGLAAAIYLEEFSKSDRWYNRLIELNIQNLASVPSVVYGILGLAFIARGFLGFGFTVMTAALILTMVVLPTVVIASREALRAVPASLREGSIALGATEWETVYRQVLPAAVPGIATGTILATSRALGESAPLLLVGALTFVTFNPTGFDSLYTVLPLAIFRFISEARLEFRPLAAASSVVLLVLLLGLNSLAIYLRNRFEKKLR
jgi:phosphate transport system permease protein